MPNFSKLDLTSFVVVVDLFGFYSTALMGPKKEILIVPMVDLVPSVTIQSVESFDVVDCGFGYLNEYHDS